jgi:hypothetical protein
MRLAYCSFTMSDHLIICSAALLRTLVWRTLFPGDCRHLGNLKKPYKHQYSIRVVSNYTYCNLNLLFEIHCRNSGTAHTRKHIRQRQVYIFDHYDARSETHCRLPANTMLSHNATCGTVRGLYEIILECPPKHRSYIRLSKPSIEQGE